MYYSDRPTNSRQSGENGDNRTTSESGQSARARPARRRLNSLVDIFEIGNLNDTLDYIVYDVIRPNVKRIISDIVGNGVDMMLGLNPKVRSNSSGNAAHVPYHAYYDSPEQESGRHDKRREPSITSYTDVLFNSRGDAEFLKYMLLDIQSSHKSVNVAQYKELLKVHIGINLESDYTDNKYGWTSLNDSNVHVKREYDGYVLCLPPLQALGAGV